MLKKPSILLLMCILIPVSLVKASFTTPENPAAEKEAIKKVIMTAYVDGLQNLGDLELTKKGFHPGFELLGINNNSLTKFPIYNWIEYAEFEKSNGKEREKTTCEFEMIDITGDAAIAKINLFREGKHIYTDYLSLYKFKDGWKIVSKIYQSMAPPPPPKEDK